MEKRNIGKSGLSAPFLGMGTWAIGGGSWWGDNDDALSVKAILTAVEQGITWVDTAPIYGLYHSEEVVGEALKHLDRDKIILSTKCGLEWRHESPVLHKVVDGVQVYRDLSEKSILEDVEESLKRLGTDHIDIYYAHNPAKDTSVYPVEDTVRALMDLKKEGKVLALGLSNAQPDVIQDWLDHGCELDIIQRKYSMLTRNVEEGVLPLCREKGMSYHAYSPLERGILAGTVPADRVVPKGDARDGELWWKPDRLPSAVKFVDGLADICEEYQCTRVQLAVAFLRAQGDFVNVICGAHKPEQIEADAPAADVELSSETVADIRKRLAALDAEFE